MMFFSPKTIISKKKNERKKGNVFQLANPGDNFIPETSGVAQEINKEVKSVHSQTGWPPFS